MSTIERYDVAGASLVIQDIRRAVGVCFLLLFAAFSATAQQDSLEIDLPFPFGGEDPFNPSESPDGFDLDWPLP